MTITYSLDVSKTRFCGFAKLLARWKGSIYKILWKEFLVFCAGYIAISVTYRCLLNSYQRTAFEKVVLFVESLTDMIPLSFVLGFYVSLVVGRWWAQYDAIPWPDRLCLMIGAYVHGADERSRLIRRTLARYLILLQALTFQAVSPAVKRRFPTPRHLVAAGMMTKEELSVYEKIDFVYGKWWLPCQWFSSLLMRAKKECRIKDSILLDGLFRELLNYRNSCGTMMSYDWISVPLVYTQVVTLATYMYAVSLMIGRQYLDTSKNYAKHQVDLYVPFFTIIQFFFYVGWLKVAEQIVNPYGEDDDDFELNWCLDRTVHVRQSSFQYVPHRRAAKPFVPNGGELGEGGVTTRKSQVVYLIVDHLQTKHPKIRKDFFWDELEPRLPQTKNSAKSVENPQLGSAVNLEVEEAEYLPMDTFLEEDKEENVYSSDSVRQMSGLRSSFIMRALSPAFRKTDSNRNLRGFGNPGFFYSSPPTPAASRKSSFRSFVKRVSPSHSRTSSVSYGAATRRQPHNNNRTHDPQEPDKQRIEHEASQEVVQSVSPTNPDVDLDPGVTRLEGPMPPIPEEPSRASREVDCQEVDGSVQGFVKEANEVLRELNRAIGVQGHQTDCALKGYESCCSLDSGSSSSDSSEVEETPAKTDDVVIVVQDS